MADSAGLGVSRDYLFCVTNSSAFSPPTAESLVAPPRDSVATSKLNAVLIGAGVWWLFYAGVTFLSMQAMAPSWDPEQAVMFSRVMQIQVLALIVWALSSIVVAVLRYRTHPHAKVFTKILGAFLLLNPLIGTALGLWILIRGDRFEPATSTV